METFTPGPYIVKRDERAEFKDNGYRWVIFSLGVENRGTVWDTREIAHVNSAENANLFAAAPDLLAALKELSFRAVSCGLNVGAPVEFVNAITIAQRAIHNAEGKEV